MTKSPTESIPAAAVSKIGLNEVSVWWKRAIRAAMRLQETAPDHPESGGFIPPEWGTADPSHVGTSALLAGMCSWYLVADQLDLAPPAPRSELLARSLLAMDYLLRVQRPSGLIDLRSCNYDSAPDTAFVVQQFCAVLDLAKTSRARKEFAPVAERLECFIRRAIPGIAGGGFHTPNHRWIICSALAQASQHFPDLAVKDALGRYLAEGIDIDAEGMFLERSSGIYDAVCDRSLLFIHEALGLAEPRRAALANLEANLQLLNPDGSVETGLSHRQDTAQVLFPLNLAACYLQALAIQPDARFSAAAAFLWDRAPEPKLSDLTWLAYSLVRWGQLQPDAAVYTVARRAALPKNGLWRRSAASYRLSVFQGKTHLASLVSGNARIESVRIAQSYMGVGRFQADLVTEDAEGLTLTSKGDGNSRRPGYELPVGKPVPRDGWDEALAERSVRRLAPPHSELAIRCSEQAVLLRYRTLDGEPGVLAQLTLDFPPGGIWRAAGTRLKTQAGQVLFLTSGFGTMRYGGDTIELGPGASAHQVFQMRDSELVPDSVRVIIPLLTPVDHELTIRCLQQGIPEA